MEPQVQYVRSADGTNIAFYDVGEGVPLIISPNMWCHLTVGWAGEAPAATAWLVSEGFRVIRFDMRGMGLSDRSATDFSLDAQAADVDALRERLGLERFALFGFVFGTPLCMLYAARYPERVTHLLMAVPFADGEALYRQSPTLQGLESLRDMGLRQWELYVRAHAATLAAMLDLPNMESLSAAMLQSATPESLGACVEALRSVDLTSSLGAIRTPTLVFGGGNPAPTGALIQDVVAGIADARVVRLQSPPNIFEIPNLSVIPHVVRFILGREASEHAPDGGASKTAQTPLSGTAVILFADIADSTALTERLGDTAFREKARALDDALRAAVRNNGGAVIDAKTLGDGILATFPAASQAIAAALACGAAGDAQGLLLHLGLHAGDVIREADNVFGGAVNIAARISALSAPGEVLVSDIVRGLARTSAGVLFEDRGEHALKGIAEPQRVFAVRAESARS